MKRIAFIGLWISTLVMGILIGIFAGPHWLPRGSAKGESAGLAVATNPEVELAARVADTTWHLAYLRLSETNQAILALEESLHASLSKLAEWNRTSPPDSETRKARDTNLMGV